MADARKIKANGIEYNITSSLVFQNKTVASSAWQADTTYAEYPYRAAIACAGVTAAKHFPDVVFENGQEYEEISKLCQSYNGGIYIYSTMILGDTITIPTIVCTYVGG